MKKLHRRYLYFAVFMSGMSTLAVELSASRLLGPAFGVSNLVWASIIGLILIYLTLGYFIGGAWADRSPFPKTMYTALAWGALTAGLVPLISRPVLRQAADAFEGFQVGVLFGSFTAVLILFSIPVTLLGVVSPFAIRLAITDPRHSGTTSGRIYAISTLGSFLGTFLPVLVLIPSIGTTYTFLLFSGVLNMVALLGLWLVSGWKSVLPWLWMPVVILLVTFLWGKGVIKATSGQIYETESAYNYIQVLERDGYRYLRLNEGQGIHSVWHLTDLEYAGPWEQFLVAPFFNPPQGGVAYSPEDVKSMAIIGLAAGTIARQASAVFGSLPIDGFEIDPQIIEVGRKYFDMNEPNLNAIPQDGRWGLEQSSRRYTIIAVDAYRPPYIPWHMTTREFFQIGRHHLTEDGVLVINVGRSPDDRSLIDGLVETVQTVFPSVYVMDVPGSFNSMVYATAQKTDFINLFLNFEGLKNRPDIHPLLLTAMQKTIVYLQPLPENKGKEIVFTDDWAPIELITNKLVLDFVFSGGLEELK
jgi:predicted membrane-bound spermidine synthase